MVPRLCRRGNESRFSRAHELAAGIIDAAERFDVYYSQWAGCMVRGEPEISAATAETPIRTRRTKGRRRMWRPPAASQGARA